MCKIDPYLNVDAGTISPMEHGECFIVDDGKECDLDLGNYERFLNRSLRGVNSLTTGTVYSAVIEKERKGEYLGATVQIVPHLTNEIVHQLRLGAGKADICVVEVGGTVGHLESAPFLEAARQMQRELGPHLCFIHLSHVPVILPVNEQKTMPSQESTMLMRQSGIQPDVIIGRCTEPLTESTKYKIMDRCNVDFVASSPNVASVYEVPLALKDQGLDAYLLQKLKLEPKNCANCGGGMDTWRALVQRIKSPTNSVTVGICGKYVGLEDSYKSVEEALRHAGARWDTRVEIRWISAETFEGEGGSGIGIALSSLDGVIVPQGWGSRGAEGKIAAIRYIREHKIPFLGICYGFQMAVIEYSRSLCGLAGANSTEIDPQTSHPVVCILPEQLKKEGLGGTARLGLHKIALHAGSIAYQIYGSKTECSERFRHRYEVNPDYIARLQDKGLVFSGRNFGHDTIMQYLELPEAVHPFFLATQAHPEYKSRLEDPSPPFVGFIQAALKHRKQTTM